MVIIGYILAFLVGASLGVIGSGGSILTLPILVYLMGVGPVTATAYSLFIVGVTSLVGGIKSFKSKNADLKTVFIFGVPSIIAVYITRAYLLPWIPQEIANLGSFTLSKDLALMLLFAVVMIASAFSMIKSKNKSSATKETAITYNYPMILIEGLGVGTLTGLVGAGGGFLIIPALVLLAKMPMKLAVGTSLLIIASKSLIGFLGDLQTSHAIDWNLLALFSLLSVAGILMGLYIAKRLSGESLTKGFGYFVLVMGFYIMIAELFF